MLVYSSQCCVESRFDPLVHGASVFYGRFPVRNLRALRLTEHVTGCVPQFVAEVAIALDTAHVEANVAPGRGQRGEREAQGIGAVPVNPFREFLARRFLNCRSHMRLHQP